MSTDLLAELTQPQRDRLAFVELRARFIGEIQRQDLVTRFGKQSAAATRDLAIYKELAPGNIDYDAKAKSAVTRTSNGPGSWNWRWCRTRTSFVQAYLHPALEAGLLEMTLPDTPKSRLQRYRLTPFGCAVIAEKNHEEPKQ